jgi:hypothetical protein
MAETIQRTRNCPNGRGRKPIVGGRLSNDELTSENHIIDEVPNDILLGSMAGYG